MNERIRVAICGLGPIGRRITAAAADKRSLSVAGAMDVSPLLAGQSLASLVEGAPDVPVAGSLDELMRLCSPQVVLHATGSLLSQVYPQFEALAEAGVNVVSTCEEASYPLTSTALAALGTLDALCKRRAVRLLGTGINPGFAMDVWPLVATATHSRWHRIEVRRVLDAAARRAPLQRKVGVGMSEQGFHEAAAVGAIGHVGLAASAHMLAKGLGRKIACKSEVLRPVLARGEVASQYYTVHPGQVAGIEQEITCELVGGGELVLHLEMYLGAPAPSDEVTIHGESLMRIIVAGGFPGDAATAALVTNTVAPLLASPPGYHTMLDLPLFGCAP